ncbi:hypothetical protein Fmac_029605 [Flemingia macrophylla]|uniref:Dihydroxy-acid/6-phosphogluconate dehydratase N-terminal domain-containing protein n=1 Tax=Flemingia macrophylla TaxID=520843 RepID=A0ABD1LAU6_9FABA
MSEVHPIPNIGEDNSSTPAEDPLKLDECCLAGKYLLELLKMDLKSRDIIKRKSLCNAMVIVMTLGGSTNAVLHLIAIAKSVGSDLTLDDFQKVRDEVLFLADLKPSGNMPWKMFTRYCLLIPQEVALLTDGRFSGGSHEFLVGHIVVWL